MAEPSLDTQQIILGIMKRYGARCTPEEFQAAVNVTFHDFESQVYDEAHADMWASLPRQFTLLIDDCLSKYPGLLEKARVLDIGAGTGLASSCLLETAIGPRVVSIDLLDTSEAMLKQAIRRSARWNLPVQAHLGLIDDLPPGNKYEIIVTCSVLHHVPDLQAFFGKVREHQAPGGIFMHLQDPNLEFVRKSESDRSFSKQLKRRVLDHFARFRPGRIYGRISRELTGKQGQDYVSRTNRALLEAGVITSPLKVADLYAITDIHASNGRGISIEQIRGWVPDYECLSQRSYGFFGKLWSHLPPDLKVEEERLSQANTLSGAHIAAAWRLKG